MNTAKKLDTTSWNTERLSALTSLNGGAVRLWENGESEIPEGVWSGLNVRYIDVLCTHHTGVEGKIQEFWQVIVVTKTKSKTYHDMLVSEWMLVDDGIVKINEDEYGECSVDWNADYHGEDLELVPMKDVRICANDKDVEVCFKIAEMMKAVISAMFAIDVTNMPVLNLEENGYAEVLPSRFI